MSATTRAAWFVSHGLVRFALSRGARQGDLDARLMVDPAYRDDPFPSYEQLRTSYPLVDGVATYISVHHDVCTELLRSADFGVLQQRQMLPAPVRALHKVVGRGVVRGPLDPPSMLAVDPPDHTRYRKLVNRVFTAKAVAALRERTVEIAGELLDGLAANEGEPVDLVGRYAGLLPVTVISEILGVPVSMREELRRLGDGGANSLDPGMTYAQYRRSQTDLAQLHRWFTEHIAGLRANPGDDLLSRLISQADEEGGRLSELELRAVGLLILGAGFETTVNLISNGAVQLFHHPAQRAELADDPSLWPNAVEEILRFDSPVQRIVRLATRDTQLAGVPMSTGDLVVGVLGGANRDPRKFVLPQQFDIHRDNAREHLALSSGIHYCLGAALAKMEGEVALRMLFERFPTLRPAGPPRRRQTTILRGYDAVPVLTNVDAVAHQPSSLTP